MEWTVKRMSPWPKKTISIMNGKAPMTARQKGFAGGLARTVNRSLNVKNRR